MVYINRESLCQRMQARTCVTSEDSDKPVHSHSLVRTFIRNIWITTGAIFLHLGIEKFHQHRLILGVHVRKCIFSR